LLEEQSVIGGEGMVVEIDGTKMGKRNNNRGHSVDGIWVVSGFERAAERKIFLVRVQERSSPTLKATIQKYVKTRSIIYADCWKGYS
jgi:hypothetical protein